MKALRKRLNWIFLTLFLLPLLVCGGWYWWLVRQQRLDHALIAAIKLNDIPTAVSVLRQGANANAIDKSEKPVQFVSLLMDFWYTLREGRKPTTESSPRPPALLLPYWCGGVPQDNPTLVQALLEHGANPTSVDHIRNTVLQYACDYNHPKSLGVLLEHHLPPDVRDDEGTTPLMSSEYDCARLLLEHRADVHARDNQGRTALMYPHHRNTVRLLLDNNADVNAIDRNGQTVLIVAVIRGEAAANVRFLLEHGANASIKDSAGKTALNYAKQSGDHSLIRLLQEEEKKEEMLNRSRK